MDLVEINSCHRMRLNSVILLNLYLILSSCSVSKEMYVEKTPFLGPSDSGRLRGKFALKSLLG